MQAIQLWKASGIMQIEMSQPVTFLLIEWDYAGSPHPQKKWVTRFKYSSHEKKTPPLHENWEACFHPLSPDSRSQKGTIP